MADDISQTPVTVSTPPTTDDVSTQPLPQAQIFHPNDVHGTADLTIIPRENDWVQPNGTATAVPDPLPMTAPVVEVPPPAPSPSPVPIPEPEITPIAPVEPTTESSEPVSDAPADPNASTEEKPAGEGEEKSPLEILEEILASAGAEKEQKEKEEAEKKAVAEQEKAEMAAKEAAFQVEAQAKIADIAPALAEAKQQRDSIDAQFKKPVDDGTADDLQIKQLKHDTIQQPE